MNNQFGTLIEEMEKGKFLKEVSMKMSSRFLVLLLAAGTGLQAKNYTLNQHTSSKCNNNVQECYKQKFSSSNKKCSGYHYEIKVGDTVTIELAQGGIQWLPGVALNAYQNPYYFKQVKPEGQNSMMTGAPQSIQFKAIKPTPDGVLTDIQIKRFKENPTLLKFKIKE